MKKLSVLFAAVMMFVTVGTVSAQKIASMDYEAVLSAMPETKKMTTGEWVSIGSVISSLALLIVTAFK